MKTASLLISLCLVLVNSLMGPLSTQKPVLKSVSNPHVTPSSVFGSNLKAPYETNAFYENLVLGTGLDPINLIPYIVKIEGATNSLGVGFPQHVRAQWASVSTPYAFNWVLSVGEGKFDSHEIISSDKLSLTLKFTKASKTVTMPLVRGSAYITAQVEGLTPSLYTQGGVISATLADGTKVFKSGTSDKFIVELSCGGFWALYTSSKVEVNLSRYFVKFVNPFTGTYRIAYLGKNANSQSILDKYSDAIPTQGNIDYSFSGDSADLSFSYPTKSLSGGQAGSPLIFALPHHMDVLQSPHTENLEFATVKGKVKAIVGDKWLMKQRLSKITWQAPRDISDQQKKKALKLALTLDINYFSDKARLIQKTIYGFGVQVSRLARQALIAESLGQTALHQKAVNALERMITTPLDGSFQNKLVYDSTWGGLLTSLSLPHKDYDYGNGIYKEHYAQYGYALYAVAVLGKAKPAFIQKYKQEILYLVRDFANPSTSDQYFPVTRSKDWFYGHSWGQGLVAHFHNRYLQSGSEAIFGYYAVTLLGDAFKDINLFNWGRLLTAMEIRSQKKYIEMLDSSVYPYQFSSNKMVGVLWDTKADYRTFYGVNPEYIHGLQMLPFAPITEQVLSKPYVRANYATITQADAYNEWLSYMIMAMSVVNQPGAWNKFQSTSKIHYYGRNSKSNTIWWIATRI